MELTFTKEAIPTIVRAGGSGREAEKWEEHLAPAKETPDESYRLWDYASRPSAVSRMTSVRERLTKAVPSENWKLAVRPVPGTEDAVHPEGTVDAEGNSIAGTSATKYGVYVMYVGTFTDEEVAENQRKHDERSARVKAARAAAAEREAAEPAPESTEPTELTPAQRVKQARTAKAS